MKKRTMRLKIIILGVISLISEVCLVTLLSSMLANLTARQQQMFPSLLMWSLVGLFAITIITIAIYTWRKVDTESDSFLAPQSSANRHRMLAKVRAIIKNGLMSSMPFQLYIPLRMQEHPEVLADLGFSFVHYDVPPLHPLPEGTGIAEVYDKTHGELLILGVPGAGKTALLLELTNALLDRAVKDESYPIPVVFSLTSWATKRLPLAAWIVEELNIRYQVPSSLGGEWVTRDQIEPLFDDLDKVPFSAREACIKAINTYRHEHGLVPTVICCRTSDYIVQETHLRLLQAVEILPLTEEQVEKYLTIAKPSTEVETLYKAYREDKELQELMTTPLMLSIVAQIYERKQFDADLVMRMLERHSLQAAKTDIQRLIERYRSDFNYSLQKTQQ